MTSLSEDPGSLATHGVLRAPPGVVTEDPGMCRAGVLG
jgi:hypothetical protein